MQNRNAFTPMGLPTVPASAVLAGRVWCPDRSVPALVAVRGGELVDVSARAVTLAEPLDRPEVVPAVNGRAEVVGATLGSDVKLRDIEDRSARVLGKAKDHCGCCAIDPFIRLFDGGFTLDAVRAAALHLGIEGEDENEGFVLEAISRMQEISCDPLALVRQACGPHHPYLDDFMLFLGTKFSPLQDCGAPGAGFTPHRGDMVTIASPAPGAHVDTVQRSDAGPPWNGGIGALHKHLRGARMAAL
jgi:fumarylacetoacetate (FAA) hydrolase family protein